MSLFHPPPNFPPHLVPFWPLIWVQVLMLRAAMRAAYGKGVQYHWSVTPCGRVFPTSVDWIPGQKSEREWLKPAAHPNARLAAALDGSLLTPSYSFISAHPGGLRRGQKSCQWHDFPVAGGPEPQSAVLAALDPGLRRDERMGRNLPLPET